MIIGSMLYKFKARLINLTKGGVHVFPDAIIRNGTSIKSNRGEIIIDSGTAIEKGTYISAFDGGKIKLGKNVFFNKNCIVVSRREIEIGDNTLFGPGVFIYDHDHSFSISGVDSHKVTCSPIVIEEGCWIGAGCIILRGTHIGQGTIIGAGTVVKGEIPPRSVVKSNISYTVEALH